MHHFLILTNRHEKVLHGIVIEHAQMGMFEPGRADWFAVKYNLSKCILCETYDTEEEACARLERFSKWSRAKKWALIDQSNPGRRDLAVRVMRYERHL